MKKPSNKRMLTAFLFFVVIGIGIEFSTGLGTPSSFGWDSIATICPVGFVETFLAKWVVTPHGLICIGIAVVLVLVFGRSFCGWICPIPFLRRGFGGKKYADKEHSDLKDTCSSGCEACAHRCKLGDSATAVSDVTVEVASDATAKVAGKSTAEVEEDGTPAKASGDKVKRLRARIRNSPLDSRHAVLFGALASTAIFGFPVFCLICPVGLSVATFIGLWRLIRLNETTLSLIIFPIILIVEIFVMRRWCHRLCPLSAAMSLISKGNKTLRPTVDSELCLRETGKAECHACYAACPEAIDLHMLVAGAPLNECMKCHECASVCPTDAIKFPLMPVPVKEGTQVSEKKL